MAKRRYKFEYTRHRLFVRRWRWRCQTNWFCQCPTIDKCLSVPGNKCVGKRLGQSNLREQRFRFIFGCRYRYRYTKNKHECESESDSLSHPASRLSQVILLPPFLSQSLALSVNLAFVFGFVFGGVSK